MKGLAVVFLGLCLLVTFIIPILIGIFGDETKPIFPAKNQKRK